MFSNSYITKSGQAWKLWVGISICLLSGIPLFWGLQRMRGSADPGDPFPVVLVLIGIGLAILSLAWLWLSVRCRKCKASLVWKAMRELPHDKWMAWLLSTNACPVCQDEA